MSDDKNDSRSPEESKNSESKKENEKTEKQPSEDNDKTVSTHEASPKVETKEEEKDKISKSDFDALKGMVSSKDKKLAELTDEINKIKMRDAVKDLLLESDFPDVIKSKLKNQIDSLTPESFKSVGEDLLDIYNNGKESYKSEQSNKLNRAPSSEEQKPINDKIKNAKTLEELWEVTKQLDN